MVSTRRNSAKAAFGNLHPNMRCKIEKSAVEQVHKQREQLKNKQMDNVLQAFDRYVIKLMPVLQERQAAGVNVTRYWDLANVLFTDSIFQELRDRQVPVQPLKSKILQYFEEKKYKPGSNKSRLMYALTQRLWHDYVGSPTTPANLPTGYQAYRKTFMTKVRQYLNDLD
jgi:L-2-hydroxyglutarate oxidase LhgO